MNWQHMKTILWLRSRIVVNQLKRTGILGTLIMVGLICLSLVVSISMFFVALFAGIATLPKASPTHIMYLWDGILFGFIFFWMMGLFIELQRSELLSLEKLLHLPISLKGTFVFNYFSSLISPCLIVFVPGMVGLCIASVVAKGPAMLVLFPLLFGVLFMVTAITYQFRGWLATMMANPRRRRTIIMMITAGFILLSQLPQIANMTFWRSFRNEIPIPVISTVDIDNTYASQVAELTRAVNAKEIEQEDFREQFATLERIRLEKHAVVKKKNEEAQKRKQELKKKKLDQMHRGVEVASAVIPLGWPAYGARAASQSNPWPGIFGTLGVCLIGVISIWRSYSTTLKFHRGGYQSGKTTRKKRVSIKAKPKPPTSNFLERQLPWLSERATVVALANLRSLIRAPELKMMLLTPIILLFVFGSALMSFDVQIIPAEFRPALAMGAITMTMFCLLQLFHNQFGFDRGGFRVFVLAPAPRSEILLGKNISLAPICIGFGVISLTLLQLLIPQQPITLLASFVQLLSAYFIVCMFGNWVSIFAPFAMAAGSSRSSKAARPTLVTGLLQFVCSLLLPVAISPSFGPLGMHFLFEHFLFDYLGWPHGIPIYLILSLIQLIVVVFIYRFVLKYQGQLLQRRELKILEKVSTQNE